MKIVILSNQVLSNHPDELDVINQRDMVKLACEKLSYEVCCLSIGDNLKADFEKVKLEKPDVVFNLMEASWGIAELCYVVPALLNAYKIPYTGVPLDALFVTGNKVLAKKLMQFNKLPTANFFAIKDLDQLNPLKTYIAKPIWEEASVGISSDFIFKTSEKEKLKTIKNLPNSHYFIEEFIDGRELNISLLADKNGVEVLPIAEILFSDYFDDKPKIVGYLAKWDENSEEYKQTNRSFNTLKHTKELENKLNEICLKCWESFNLKGYARVDFRIDKDNNIFILEINGNPCIAPDSGFVAAGNQKGYSTSMMVERIISDLN